MKLSFTKMQGCANDYIYLDCRTSGVPENIAALSEALSRRHFSIGADGIICICAPRHSRGRRHDAHLQCGRQRGQDVRQRHPLRGRVAVHPRHVQKPKLAIDTLSGLKTVARMGEGLWQVEMGAYTAHGSRRCPP